MELFDKRFVYFMWDDELEGKVCFVANNMKDLIFAVENDGMCAVKTNALRYSGNNVRPFHAYVLGANCSYPFAYYDPNYEVKKAFKEGKRIQVHCANGTWINCDEPKWYDDCAYRIKPEEEKWIAYLARVSFNGKDCHLTACKEDAWEMAQKEFNAKTKLFVGTCDEAVKWYESREKFAEIIKAWEDGKTIQVYEHLFKKWDDCVGTLEWYTDCEYRVKPECPCEDGINSKVCAGCPKDEERKQTFRPFKDCEELVEFWSKNYQTGFRPAYTKPLIWVRFKCDGRERLIVAFGKGFGTDFVGFGNKANAVPLQRLFDDYEFLDGNPCGAEC